jgi:hypothetical protein
MNKCSVIIENVNLRIYYLFTWDENYKNWKVLGTSGGQGSQSLMHLKTAMVTFFF